ncbi:MAG: LPS export ABC transporter periplasmic protein LptC, partial [Flavobacteriaceae bacterium]|nr:LPS export ABC transporter periplasmic protein LptC [Flavobacteriaceae bacterium]
MAKIILYKLPNIATILIVAMFFSCGNDIKEVEDFLAEKNLPIGVVKNINLIHTDSGRVKTNLIAPIMHDFSN